MSKTLSFFRLVIQSGRFLIRVLCRLSSLIFFRVPIKSGKTSTLLWLMFSLVKFMSSAIKSGTWFKPVSYMSHRTKTAFSSLILLLCLNIYNSTILFALNIHIYLYSTPGATHSTPPQCSLYIGSSTTTPY